MGNLNLFHSLCVFRNFNVLLCSLVNNTVYNLACGTKQYVISINYYDVSLSLRNISVQA